MIIPNIKLINLWQIITRLSLVFLYLIVCSVVSAAAEAMPKSTIDLNKLPTPGQDAFWAHNPMAPYQKILLVPSNHTFNLRFIRSGLAKEMKSMDVLIVESRAKTPSWNDVKKLKKAFRYKIEDLKKAGAIQDHPFEYSDLNYPESVGSWTDILKELEPSGVPYMKKLFKPILGDIPLQNVHPFLIARAMSCFFAMKAERFFGIDNQIVRDFNLQKKHVLVLESLEDLDIIQYGIQDILPSIKEGKITLKTMSGITVLALHGLKLVEEDSPKEAYDKIKERIAEISKQLPWTKEVEEEKAGDAGARNQLWLPKLLKYFENSPHASFGVVVGANHFPGPANGLLTLLSQKGFTFTPFEQGAVAVTAGVRPVRGIELQTEHRKKIMEAEQNKAVIKVKLGAATQIVDKILEIGNLIVNVIEKGKLPKHPQEIRDELINATAKIIALDGRVKENYYYAERLYFYIEARNKIFADATIINKTKALEVLQRNPKFGVDEVKDALK